MNSIKDIIAKFRMGDGLDDMELMLLAERTGQAANVLYGMGDMFILAAQEANRIFMACCDYAVERGLVKFDAKYDVEKISSWVKRKQR